MEKVATRAEIVESWALEDVITANEMLDYMALSTSGEAVSPANDPAVEKMLRGLR